MDSNDWKNKYLVKHNWFQFGIESGIGSISRLYRRPNYNVYSASEQAQELAGDWKRVGDSLRWAIGSYGRDHQRQIAKRDQATREPQPAGKC